MTEQVEPIYTIDPALERIIQKTITEMAHIESCETCANNDDGWCTTFDDDIRQLGGCEWWEKREVDLDVY